MFRYTRVAPLAGTAGALFIENNQPSDLLLVDNVGGKAQAVNARTQAQTWESLLEEAALLQTENPAGQIEQASLDYKSIEFAEIYNEGSIEEAKKLQSGSFGSVYQVTLLADGEQRALKVVDKASKKCAAINCKEALQHEANLANKFNHDNIVKVHNLYEDGKYFYIEMELVQGGDLCDFQSERHLSNRERQFKPLIEQMVVSLQQLHAKGIMHRDVKLDNFVLTKDEKPVVKLTDFGFATEDKSVFEPKGSPPYIAPEVWASMIVFYFLIN